MEYIDTPCVQKVQLQRNLKVNKNFVQGNLYLYPASLLFKCDADDTTTNGFPSIPGGEIELCHCHIESIERLPLTSMGTPLYIRCKTFLVLKLIIRKERDANSVEKTLNRLSRPVSLEEISVLNYRPSSVNCQQSQRSGWHVFDISVEYERFGVPNNQWVYSNLNEEFKLCPTYPKWLFVPKSATRDTIVGSSKFRSQRRLPALSYLYKTTGAAICRCSQPCVGMTNNRSQEDEEMITAIRKANPSGQYNKLYIVDTRPKVNAMVNKAGGKGYEDVKFYTDVLYNSFPIQNIHVMRESINKVRDTVESAISSSSFLQGIEEAGWLKHLKIVIDTAKFIAQAIAVEGYSVLIHCSDGWDRTAQTSSLAQIILDPYYRTLNGFQVLVEKEWLAFGHKFVDRCGLLHGNPDEVSPIFLQFLDCVYQLQNQYPMYFEFNESFLIELFDLMTSGKFGTFLGNNQQTRESRNLSERTFSLWGYMWENIARFMNPYYEPITTLDRRAVLTPSTEARDMQLWTKMYCRYDISTEAKTTLEIDLESKQRVDKLEEELKGARI